MSNKSALVQRDTQTQFGGRLILLALAALMVVPNIGCQSWRNLGLGEAVVVSYRDMVWARRAYNLRYGNCNRAYEEHFQNGFCAGYSDVSNGGDGYVPALPPAEYRGYEFQSTDGAKCVNSWFEGYPAGVKAAKGDKSGTYHDVLISRMIDSAVTQDKAKPVLPSDVPVVSPQQQSSRATGVPIVQPNFAPPQFSLPPINQMPSVMSQTNYAPAADEMLATPLPLPFGYSAEQGSIAPNSANSVIPADYIAPPESNEPLPYAMSAEEWKQNQEN
ncbi:MAG: hypothetical protein AB8B55_14210 [Mariniblastus sp.]